MGNSKEEDNPSKRENGIVGPASGMMMMMQDFGAAVMGP